MENENAKGIMPNNCKNERAQRKARKLSMEKFAEISGVSLGSLKRFENTGEISLVSLLKLAIVLDCAEEFEQLFVKEHIMSIQEIIDGKV